jgi:hypothetical protein
MFSCPSLSSGATYVCPLLQILSFLVALCLLGITGLSATAILRSKEDYWTAFDSNGQKPTFKFQ